MSEKEPEYKPAEIGNLFNWVQDRFKPLLDRAIAGDEFSSDITWIRNILLGLERRLQQNTDEQLADLTQIEPHLVRLDFELAVDEFNRQERQLEDFYKKAVNRRENDKETLKFYRESTNENTLQFTKFVLIGYGIGIVTVLTALISKDINPDYIIPLQKSLWVLVIGLTGIFICRVVGSFYSLVSIITMQWRVENIRRKQPNIKKLIAAWVIPGILATLLLIALSATYVVSVALLPGALVYFLYQLPDSSNFLLEILNWIGAAPQTAENT